MDDLMKDRIEQLVDSNVRLRFCKEAPGKKSCITS